MSRLHSIAKILNKHMQCNCDLDKWEPERSTGHSAVCRIHKAVIHQMALDNQHGEASLAHLVVLSALHPYTYHRAESSVDRATRYLISKEGHRPGRTSVHFDGSTLRVYNSAIEMRQFSIADPELTSKLKALLETSDFSPIPMYLREDNYGGG